MCFIDFVVLMLARLDNSASDMPHFLFCFFSHRHGYFTPKTNDYCAIPLQLKDQLNERYSGARRAYLKTGGDFPFLSRPDEVNLHLQVNMTHVLLLYSQIFSHLILNCP